MGYRCLNRFAMFVIFLFFLFFEGSKSLNADDSCKGNRHPGTWTCSMNKDETLNVTLDCNLNSHKSPTLRVWSEKYPMNMKVLTIKNCDEVVLEIKHEGGKTQLSFSDLQVVNASKLHLISERLEHDLKPKRFRKRESGWFSSQSRPEQLYPHLRLWDFEHDDYDSAYDSDETTESLRPDSFLRRPDFTLPRNVIFKDIKLISMRTFPLGLSFVRGSDATLMESIKFINTTLQDLRRNFLGDTSKLKELVMENVTILEAGEKALSVHNKEATIKIINSTAKVLMDFLTCDVAKLIISGNTFEELKNTAFQCETEEFIFSGNHIGSIRGANLLAPFQSLKIVSPIVNIQGNTFDYIGDEAFQGITAPSLSKAKSNKTLSRRIFNFSKNEMRIVENRALHFPDKETDTYFDTFSVYDNAIGCSCQNIPWFHELMESTYMLQRDHFYFSWINNKNPNKCSNIPNCTLNQVIYNIYELCDENYRCPANVKKDHLHFAGELNLRELINTNKEIADSIKKLLKVAEEKGEDKKSNFESLSKMNKIQGPKALSVAADEKIERDEGEIVSCLTVIASCLILLIILICFIYLNYSRAIGFVNFPCAGRRISKYGIKRTEMESQISLNP